MFWVSLADFGCQDFILSPPLLAQIQKLYIWIQKTKIQMYLKFPHKMPYTLPIMQLCSLKYYYKTSFCQFQKSILISEMWVPFKCWFYLIVSHQGISQERKKICVLHELGNQIQPGIWIVHHVFFHIQLSKSHWKVFLEKGCS